MDSALKRGIIEEITRWEEKEAAMSEKRGFTLIEIMIVVIIIAMLAAMLYRFSVWRNGICA